MNDHGIIGHAAIFETCEDLADTLINQRHKAEIFLFQLSIIVDSETELELTNCSAFILDCSVSLPFTGQAISQWDIFPLRLQRCQIDIYLVDWMFVIKRTVVGRMRFDEGHYQNKRLFPIPLNEFAGVLLNKS